jgi:hypothetical protein
MACLNWLRLGRNGPGQLQFENACTGLREVDVSRYLHGLAQAKLLGQSRCQDLDGWLVVLLRFWSTEATANDRVEYRITVHSDPSSVH